MIPELGVPVKSANTEIIENPRVPMNRLVILVAMVLVCAVALALVLPRIHERHVVFRACFHHVAGLQPMAVVRAAGVDVGRVQTIEAHLGDQACPVEVGMIVWDPHDREIPSDSVAVVTFDSVLSPAIIDIDLRGASLPPIRESGRLKSREVEFINSDHVARNLVMALRAAGVDNEKPAQVGKEPSK